MLPHLEIKEFFWKDWAQRYLNVHSDRWFLLCCTCSLPHFKTMPPFLSMFNPDEFVWETGGIASLDQSHLLLSVWLHLCTSTVVIGAIPTYSNSRCRHRRHCSHWFCGRCDRTSWWQWSHRCLLRWRSLPQLQSFPWLPWLLWLRCPLLRPCGHHG